MNKNLLGILAMIVMTAVHGAPAHAGTDRVSKFFRDLSRSSTYQSFKQGVRSSNTSTPRSHSVYQTSGNKFGSTSSSRGGSRVGRTSSRYAA